MSTKNSRLLNDINEALNRFATMVDSGTTVDEIAFKSINKKRVDDFVYAPFNDSKARDLEIDVAKEVRRALKVDTSIPGFLFSLSQCRRHLISSIYRHI